MQRAIGKSLRDMGKAEYAKKGGKPQHARYVRLARKVARAELKKHPEYRRAMRPTEDSSNEGEEAGAKLQFGDILKGNNLPESLPVRDVVKHLSDLRDVAKEVVSQLPIKTRESLIE